MGHGGGGKIIGRIDPTPLLPAFANDALTNLGDSAVIQFEGARPRCFPDSFVVRPLFPGGDIGKLAVHGTVNDVAMEWRNARLPDMRLYHRRRAATGHIGSYRRKHGDGGAKPVSN